jgi:hypothetical protein
MTLSNQPKESISLSNSHSNLPVILPTINTVSSRPSTTAKTSSQSSNNGEETEDAGEIDEEDIMKNRLMLRGENALKNNNFNNNKDPVKLCKRWMKKYLVVPGKSWGNLGLEQQKLWTSLNCDFVITGSVPGSLPEQSREDPSLSEVSLATEKGGSQRH